MKRAAGLAVVALIGSAVAAGPVTGGVAPAAAPHVDARASAHEIEMLLDAWRFKEAAPAVAALGRVAPDAPDTKFVDGYQKFLTGDYDGAVRALEAAATAPNGPPQARPLEELAKAARDAVRDFKEERSAHAVVRYAPEDAVLAPYARDTVEAAIAALHDDLGFQPPLPIRVELYRAPSDLAAVSSLSVAEVARTGTIALCKWARLMVTTPRALSYGYPWLDSMNHELVHFAVSTLSGDRAPVWLQEGLAKFLERRWREPAGGRIAPPMEHLLAKALQSGRLISFDAMHPSMAKLPSAEDATLAFAEVENAVAYLHSKGGMAALRDAIARVAAGEDARDAVAAAAGESWPQFERGWRAFMVAQHYKTFPAIDIATTHIRKSNAIASGRKPSEEDAVSSKLRGGAPYRYLRLGNMLLARERPRAAAAEYEKGAKTVAAGVRGDPSAAWIFPVKLGRTYLALGAPDKALKALGSVQTLYPDLPWPHLIAGEAHLAMGDAAGAVDLLRASIAENPFDPRVHCALADAYGRLNGSPANLLQREQRFCKELGSPD